MLNSLQRYLLMLLLAVPFLASTANVAQTCRSESEIPASTPTGNFVDHGDGTVTDAHTGLMWAKCAAGLSGSGCTTGTATSHTWQEALDMAGTSTLAGYGDWRLPNINELRSIVEEQCFGPAINLSVFPNTPAWWNFWSASPKASISYGVWYVDFFSGSSYYGDGGTNYYGSRVYAIHVRLVRGGQ